MASKATMQKRSQTLKLQLIHNLEWWTDDLYIEVHFPIMVDLVFTTTYDFSIILNCIIPNLFVCAVCLEIGHPQKICDDGARMLSLLLYRNIPQTVHWIKVKKYIFKTTVINLVLSCGLYCTIRVLDFFLTAVSFNLIK